MKKLLFALSLATLLISCDKDNDDDTGGGSGTVSAKVDGINFNGDLAVQAQLSGGVLAFGGTSDAAQITISLGNYNGVGEYKIGTDGGPQNIATYATKNPITTYVATFVLGSGVVNVTKESGGEIEGTFSFTAVNNGVTPNTSVIVSGGTFKVKP